MGFDGVVVLCVLVLAAPAVVLMLVLELLEGAAFDPDRFDVDADVDVAADEAGAGRSRLAS